MTLLNVKIMLFPKMELTQKEFDYIVTMDMAKELCCGYTTYHSSQLSISLGYLKWEFEVIYIVLEEHSAIV